jgi:hypothetical protein
VPQDVFHPVTLIFSTNRSYPFSDLSGAKVRPAIFVSAPHSSQDIFIVPLTSKTAPLLAGEFLVAERVFFI